jgi:probable phosphoglycerate mutase
VKIVNRAIIDKALDSVFLTGVCGATDLLLVRHAEAANDVECSDGGLSLDGRKQALKLARALSEAGVSALYSAPTAAAAETAEAIARECAIEPEAVEGLGPVRVEDEGAAGAPWQAGESGAAVRVAAHRFGCNPRWDAFPGIEGSRAFRHRAIQAIEAIAARRQGQTVAIVTHACVINAYLSMVLDIPRDVFFVPSPASVSAVRIKGDAYAVRYLNSERPACPRMAG